MAVPVGVTLQGKSPPQDDAPTHYVEAYFESVIAQLWYEQPELAAGAYAAGAIAAAVPRYVPTFNQTKSWFQRDAQSSTHVRVPTAAEIMDSVFTPGQDAATYPVITVPRSTPPCSSLPANHERQSKHPDLIRYNSSKATASALKKGNPCFPESTSQTSIANSASNGIDPNSLMGSIEPKQALGSPAGTLALTTAVEVATRARNPTTIAGDPSSPPGHSTSDHGPTPSLAVTSEPTRRDPDQGDLLATANIDEYRAVNLYPVLVQLFHKNISLVHAAIVAYAMQYHSPWLIFRNYCSALCNTLLKAVLPTKPFMSTLLLHMPRSLSEALGKPHANHLLIVRAIFAVLVGIVLSFSCIMDAVTSQLCTCATARHSRHLHPRLANLRPKRNVLLFGVNRFIDCCVFYLSFYTQDLVAVFATKALVFTLCWLYMDKEFLSMYAQQALKIAIIRVSRAYKNLFGLSRFIHWFSSALVLLAPMPIAIYITTDPERVHGCLEQYSENTPLPPSHDYIYYTFVAFVVIAFIRPIVDKTVTVGRFFTDAYTRVRLHASRGGAPARPTTYIGHIRWLPEISRFCLFMTHDALMTLLGPIMGAAVKVVLAWLMTIYTIPLWLDLLMTLRDTPGYIHTAEHWIALKPESTGIRVDLVANPNKHVVSRVLASSSTAINTAISHARRGGEDLTFLFNDCAKPVLFYFAQSCRYNWCRVLAWRWLWRTPTITMFTSFIIISCILVFRGYPGKKRRSLISVSMSIALPYIISSAKPIGGLECTQDYMIILTAVAAILLLVYLWGQVPVEMQAAFGETFAGFPGGVAQLLKPTKKKLSTPHCTQPAERVLCQEEFTQTRPHQSPLSLSTVTTVAQQEQAEPQTQQKSESHPRREASPETAPMASPPHSLINILLLLWGFLVQWWTEVSAALTASNEADAAAQAAREQAERDHAAQLTRVEQSYNTSSSYHEEQAALERELSEVTVETAPTRPTQPTGPVERPWRPAEPIPFEIEDFLPNRRRTPLTETFVSYIAEEDEERSRVGQEPATLASTPKLDTSPMPDMVESSTTEENDERLHVEKDPATLTPTPKLETLSVPSTLQQPSTTTRNDTQNGHFQAPKTPPDPPSNTELQPAISGPAPRLPAPSSWSSDSSYSPKPGPAPPISSLVQGGDTEDGHGLVNQEPGVVPQREIADAERQEWSTFGRQNVQRRDVNQEPSIPPQTEITDAERDEWSTFGRQNVRVRSSVLTRRHPYSRFGRNGQPSGSQSLSVSSADAPSSSDGLTDDEDNYNYSGSSPSEDVYNLSPKSARSEDSTGSIISSNVGRRRRRAMSNSLPGSPQTPTITSSGPAIPPPGVILPPSESPLPSRVFRLPSPPPYQPPSEQPQNTSPPFRAARSHHQLSIEDSPLPDLYTRPASRPTNPVLSESAEQLRSRVVNGPSLVTTERRELEQDLGYGTGWPRGVYPSSDHPGGGNNGGGKSSDSGGLSNPSDAPAGRKGEGHVQATETTTQQPPDDLNASANSVGGRAPNAGITSGGASPGQATQSNTGDGVPEIGTAVPQLDGQDAIMTENTEAQPFIGSAAPLTATNTLKDEDMPDAPIDEKVSGPEDTGDNSKETMDLEPAAEEMYKSFQFPIQEADPMNLDDLFAEASTTSQTAALLLDNLPSPGSLTSTGWLSNLQSPDPVAVAQDLQMFLGHAPQDNLGGIIQVANSPQDDPSNPTVRPEQSRRVVNEETGQETGFASVAPDQNANVASAGPAATDVSALPEGQNTQNQDTGNIQQLNSTEDKENPRYTIFRPTTRLVQIWPADKVVENPDFSAHRAAGMKSLKSTYGESCQRYREVDMKVYDEYGEFTDKFQEAQRNMDWFDLSWEGVEQGPATQSAGERMNGDKEENEDVFSEDIDAYDEDGDAHEQDYRGLPAERTFIGDDGFLYTLNRPQTPLIQMQHDMSIIENPDYWHARKKGVKKIETMFGMGMTWREVDMEAHNGYGEDSIQFDAAQIITPWFYVFKEGADESDWDEDNSKSSSCSSDSDSGFSDPPDDYIIDAAGTELRVDEMNSMLRRHGAHRDSDSDQDFEDVPIRRRPDEDQEEGEDEEPDPYELIKSLQEPLNQAPRRIVTGIDDPVPSPYQQGEITRSQERAILTPRAPRVSERYTHRPVSLALPSKSATTPSSPQTPPNPHTTLLLPSKLEATSSSQRRRQMSDERNSEIDDSPRKAHMTSGSSTPASASKSEPSPIPPEIRQRANELGITVDWEIRAWMLNIPQKKERPNIAVPKSRRPRSADAISITAPIAPLLLFDTPLDRPIHAPDYYAIAVEDPPAQSRTQPTTPTSLDPRPAYRPFEYGSAQGRSDGDNHVPTYQACGPARSPSPTSFVPRQVQRPDLTGGTTSPSAQPTPRLGQVPRRKPIPPAVQEYHWDSDESDTVSRIAKQGSRS
ncbi:hypothetical protein DDE82_004632 [Stemphylium lycopersici]|nr:hypothetical protein DDE82_004632 [Stemphylium lycopersici]